MSVQVRASRGWTAVRSALPLGGIPLVVSVAMLAACLLAPRLAVAEVLTADVPSAAKSTAESLLQRVEGRFARLDTFSASFEQTYRSASLGHEVAESGRLFVKRPGRMRWDYRRPHKKVFLIEGDGTTLAYVPADRTASRSRMPSDAPHLQLLLGESDLLAAFTVTEVELLNPVSSSSRHLKLVPRRPIESIDTIYLEVDPHTASVARVLMIDTLKNESDLVLGDVKENAGLRDSVFRLKLPRSVEVRDLAGMSGQNAASTAAGRQD